MPSDDARARLADLRALLGSPWQEDNPLGFARVLDADERAEVVADAEVALDRFALNAEFVPVAEGGRLARLDDLVEVMREVYRRDGSLGLGYGASSLIAAVNVWTAADAAQRAEVAKVLLANRKIACAYHELDHGNDMAGTEFAAVPADRGFLLTGRKEVVTNVQRADALVVLARTEPGRGPRTHSQLLVDKAGLPADGFSYLPRFDSTGLRGVQLGGIRFDDCPVAADAVLGTRGHGLETAIRSFQVTRLGLPAMATGLLDTALRATLRHVRPRVLGGRSVADIPHVRAVLAGVFADLLMCEVFAAVAARALLLLPGE
ncbi:acyl-CoA dehydrogenase, partial [Saccharothrix sp. MB29]|nr:acyl-CoA dehydrogenase [Saccharothrix sp. MB29]